MEKELKYRWIFLEQYFERLNVKNLTLLQSVSTTGKQKKKKKNGRRKMIWNDLFSVHKEDCGSW